MNNSTHNPNFNRVSTNIRRGSNKPDLYIQAVTRQGSQSFWQDLGAVWETSKEGYLKGKLTINGEEIEIVVQTREARDLVLNRVRQQKHEAPIELDDNAHQPA
ncbi:hypothetical protein EYS14_00070 [Alteromonadaceae bacterium M269]|nr:hypothetical protein EYS14_00070 [Alteromonadaceae bacterium M269]